MCAILLGRANWQWEAAKARGLLDSPGLEEDDLQQGLQHGNGLMLENGDYRSRPSCSGEASGWQQKQGRV